MIPQLGAEPPAADLVSGELELPPTIDPRVPADLLMRLAEVLEALHAWRLTLS